MLIVTLLTVFATLVFVEPYPDEYRDLGCYRDRNATAIKGLHIGFPTDTIRQCFNTATSHGYDVFAVENNTDCMMSERGYQTYRTYGHADNCLHGVGGVDAMNVYQIKLTLSFLLTKIRLNAEESRRKDEIISSLTRKLKAESTAITNIGAAITGMGKNIADIVTQTSKIDNHGPTITGMDKRIAKNTADIVTQASKVDKHGNRITNNKVAISGSDKKIEKISRDIITETTKINNNEDAISNNGNRINNNEAAITAQQHTAKVYFVGFGYWGSFDRSDMCTSGSCVASIGGCIQYCYNKRVGDLGWNGLAYWIDGNSLCRCTYNEKGHTEDSGMLHYKFF